MIPKIAIIFFIISLTLLLVGLDYQHGNKLAVDTENTIAQAEMLRLNLQPVSDKQTTISLQQYRGKFVLINAWATWCPPCVHEFPMLIELAKKHPEQLQLVTLSADQNRETAHVFLENFESLPNAYHAFDEGGKMARGQLQIYRYPESLLLNPQGEVLAKYAGVLRPEQLQAISDILEQ